MKLRKLILPLLVAMTCVGAGVAGMSAAAAPRKDASHHRTKPLRIDRVVVAGKTGPLALRVAANIHTTVRMTIDGREVGHSFESSGRNAQSIQLSASDGIHAGANHLRITASRGGTTREATRTVTVPGWALRADAGDNAHLIVHTRAQLGVAQMPTAAPGGGVNYGWRIVDRPHRAKATLSARNDPQPVLHAKTPGRYVLQESADPEHGEEPTAFDQVTVSVIPDDPPIGAPLNTIDDKGAITIAGKSYGGGGGISYVVLERTTRAVVESGSVANDGGGIAKLTGFADQYGGGGNYMRYMMILSGRNGVPDGQLAAFAGLLKKLGTALPSEENFQALRIGLPFSVIGIPGAPAGAATTRIPGGYSDPVSGAITGYLTKNQAVDAEGTPLYDYNAGPQPTFDTNAAGSSGTTNKMTIDGKTYSATLPAGTTAGFHVVVLESLSLRELSNEALPTNGAGERTLQKNTGEGLLNAIEKPGGPIVFVQTIGKPKAAGPEWEGVVDALRRLGANSLLVNALNGTNEYALVARRGAKSPPAESSTASDDGHWGRQTYPPAHLVGTLARGRTSNYVPNVYSTPTTANPSGGVNIALMSLAYQAPQPWPELAPKAAPGEAAAAAKYICEGLNFCQPTNSCPSLRECFWQRYSADWDAKLATLGSMSYRAGKGFLEPAFLAVKEELSEETEAVANVKNYLNELQKPFESSSTRAYVDLKGISDNIWNSLQRPPDNTKSFVLGLVGKIVSLGTAAPPPASSAAAGLSAIFGLASYLSNKTGQPILGSEVKARTDALAGEMLDRIDAARKTTIGLGMLLVSDYGKLTTAYKHIDSDWTLPSVDVATSTMRTATKQWFWEALLPAGYPYLIRANGANNARYLDCQLNDRRGWPNQPDEYQMNATVGYKPDGSPINAVFFFARGMGGAMSPPAQIGDEMFRPRTGANPGLGMEKLQFFTPRVFNGQVYHAVDHSYECQVGFLPQEW